MRLVTRRAALLLLASLLALPARAAGGEVVSFETEDGVTVAGVYFDTGPDRPAVICLPMYRSGKESYAPIVPALRSAGLSVLSLDLRGHGGSKKEGEDLAGRVRSRDPELFRSMHRDVEAAILWLESAKGTDPTRIGLLGASVGCSVAVHATVENRGQIRAVVLLTPGPDYLGMPTLEHLADWDAPPTLIVTSEEEERRVRPVIEAMRAHDSTETRVVPGSGIHGTRMLGEVAGIEKEIAGFFRRHLSGTPDLRVPRFHGDDPRTRTGGFVRRTLRAKRHRGDDLFEMMVFAVGDALTVGPMVRQPFDGEATLFVRRPGDETTSAIEVDLRHPRPEETLPDARVHGPLATALGDDPPEVSRGAAGPYGWATVDLAIPGLGLGSGFQMAMELRAESGPTVTFPEQPEGTPAGRAARFYRVSLTEHPPPE